MHANEPLFRSFWYFVRPLFKCCQKIAIFSFWCSCSKVNFIFLKLVLNMIYLVKVCPINQIVLQDIKNFWVYPFWCKSLLNFTYLTMKFHNCHHTAGSAYFYLLYLYLVSKFHTCYLFVIYLHFQLLQNSPKSAVKIILTSVFILQ